jgi:hypothetical protein
VVDLGIFDFTVAPSGIDTCVSVRSGGAGASGSSSRFGSGGGEAGLDSAFRSDSFINFRSSSLIL